jgi:membrane protease YdiL (CAAX protease family)
VSRLQPGASALLWVGLMFSPAPFFYLWFWPVVRGGDWEHWSMVVVYFYFLAGTLAIARPRWSLAELGVNRQGIGLSLICGAVFALAVYIGLQGTNLPPAPRLPTPLLLIGDIAAYFGQVGPIEELLFRGLIYKALLDWRGLRWAIWGSALAFGFYHVGRSGLVAALAISLIGLVWGLIRWRAGGIVGLFLIHATYDTVSRYLWPAPMPDDPTAVVQITNRIYPMLADVIFLGLIVYLWRLHPLLERRRGRLTPAG